VTIWIAYHMDWSGFAIFETEIEALRYAVEHSMQVKAVALPATEIRT